MRRLFPLLLLFAASAAPAQEWRRGPEYDVLLSTWDIAPERIELRAGQPVRLRFVNNSERSLSFSARGFFRSAEMRRRDGADAADGTIEVPPLSTRTIALVPKAGRYKVSGGHLLHRLLGMRGTIVVE